MRNCRRLREDGTLIEEATGFYAFRNTKATKVGRCMLSQILPSNNGWSLKRNSFLSALRDFGIEIF